MSEEQLYSGIKLALDGKVLQHWCDILVNDSVQYGMSNKHAEPEAIIKAINATMDNEEEALIEVLLLLPEEGFEITPNLCVNNTEHELSLMAAKQKLTLKGKFIRTQLLYTGQQVSLLVKFASTPSLWEPNDI